MNNRGMFFQNLNQSYSDPGLMIPPSGYNINSQYQAYGPNVNNQQIPNYTNGNYIDTNNEQNYENRISKLERQVKNLDTRLQKLENLGNEEDNFYMI